MDGSILILSEVAMAYLNQGCWQITCCAHASTKKDTSKQPPPLDFGSTSGEQLSFFFILDDFVIEYVGERHTHYLRNVLKKHYEITEDWKGTKFGGIDIKWNYAPKHVERTCSP